jgi:S-layer protein
MALPNSQDQLTALCILMFDAAPGATILADLVGAHAAGVSVADIGRILATKPAFSQVYGYTYLKPEQLGDLVVERLLTADTAADAKTWTRNWVAEKLRGGESMVSVLLQAGDALLTTTNPDFAPAQAQLHNRIEVANYFSVTKAQESTWLNKLQHAVSGVTDDPASIAAGKAAIDANISGTENLVVDVEARTGQNLDLRTATTNLTLQAITDHTNNAAFNGNVYVKGDVKHLTIELIAAIDDNGTADKADDGLDLVYQEFPYPDQMRDLQSLTVKGNGRSGFVNEDGMALTLVDASALHYERIDGTSAGTPFLYTTWNPLAETIKVGSGPMALTFDNSTTVASTDTIYNFALVEDDVFPGKLDEAQSTWLWVGTNGFAQTAITAADLPQALAAAAASSVGDKLVFLFQGNTYVYQDNGTKVGAADDADFLLKIVGEMDLDLLLVDMNKG